LGIRYNVQRALAYRQLKREARHPGTTIQSKIRYKMAWDRRPILTTFADKIAVRLFVESRIGADYLVPVVNIFSRASDLNFAELPRECVLKVNHGSGGVIVVSEKADRSLRLPDNINIGWERFDVHPDSLDHEHCRALLDHWLDMSFEWWPGRAPEWAYRDVQRQIYVETFLNSQSEGAAIDYKAYVFNGKVQVIRIMQGAASETKRSTYVTREWEPLPFAFVEGGIPQKPLTVEVDRAFGAELVKVAELLMKGIDFARVDFIDDDGKLRVGEITNYPTAGNYTYQPDSFNEWMGCDWHPNYRRNFTTD
jgi:hypothetical protein